MTMETSISLKSTKESNRVIHEDTEIREGKYGKWIYIKDKKEWKYIPLGEAVYVESVEIDIDTGEEVLYLKSLSVKGNDISIKTSRANLTDTALIELVRYGVQTDKRSAPYLLKSIENQEPNAPVKYSHNKLGFVRRESGELIYKGWNGIVYDKGKFRKVSKYNGKLKIAPHGDFRRWIQMVEEVVLGCVPLEIMLASGTAGVLIDFMYTTGKGDIPNLLIHANGESSSGKTTAAMLMVSAGSAPDLNGGGMALNFADTQNALMNSIQSAVPALIDEASLVRYNPTNLLYNMSLGIEKKRMNKSLTLGESNSFHTAIAMTSEKSLLSMADENSGLLVRNVVLEGVQWTESAETADKIKNVVINHYGFMCERFAEILLRMDGEGRTEELYQQYEEFCQKLVSRAKERGAFNPLTERGSKQIAIVLLSAYILKKYLDINLNINGIMEMLEENSLVESLEQVDIGLRALDYITQFVEGNRSKFIEPLNEDFDMKECWGKIKNAKYFKFKDGSFSNKSLYIGQVYFDQIMKEGRFPDSRVVLRRLRELQILDCEKDRFVSNIQLSNEVGKVKGYIIRLKDGDWVRSVEKTPFDTSEEE